MIDWFKEKKEALILIRLVFFGLFVFGLISWAVFYYLGLDFSDLREIGDSKETGVTNKEKLIERAFTIIGGGVAVLGLFALIWRSILMGRQIKDSQEQTKISQKSQYSERFVKSVDQVANENLGVFLGGLASLDALSREKEEEYKRVWKYLGDFLRYHKLPKDEGKKAHQKVNAIVQMLKIRKREYEDKEFRLDLSKVHLERAKLNGVHLEGANLVGAHLIEAKLEGANLEGANLVGVHLIEAKLEGAHLEEANLVGASLMAADLVGANLVGAKLEGAHLEEANLRGALLGGIMESGEAQDLTRTHLASNQLRGTFYDEAGPPPTLPDDISEEDKPKAISDKEWGEL